MERDVEVRALARADEAARRRGQRAVLRPAWTPLTGERSYIGRIGLFDEDDEYEPLLLDWRAPAARAVLRRHRRQPGDMRRRRQFHTRGRQRRRLHRRGARPSRRRRRGGDAAPARGRQRAARRGHARHRRDDPGRAGRDHPARPPGRAGDRGRPGHRQDRGGAAPRRLPALHPARADGTPRRARGRAQPGVPATTSAACCRRWASPTWCS